MLLLGLLLLVLAGCARAECAYTNNPGTVTFAPPATITLPNSLPVGTVLWTTPPVAPTNPSKFICIGTTRSGVQNNLGGQPGGGDDTLFPTNIPGLSYRLLHPDTSSPLHAYPNQPVNNVAFDTPTALQLVVTGPVAPGSVLTGGVLGQWNVDMCDIEGLGNPHCTSSMRTVTNPAEIFSTSSITFVAPACTVAVDPTVVTLPTVFGSAFGGAGSTTGQTPFNVQLTCSAGANLAITLATSTPVAGAPGVIAPTTGNGYAQNVGVQILDKTGAPIAFGSPIPAGTTPNGAFSVLFHARYYQTGAFVSAGKVSATATYTLTYP